MRFRPRALSSPGPFARKTSAGPSLGIDAPWLKGREALPIPKAVDVAPEPGAQAEAAKAAAGKKLSGEDGGGMRI